ncbi:MAG: thiamine diphosphokinase [Sporolactobacillus sp.]
MQLAIVAGGPEALIPSFNESAYREVLWIGCDRGALVLVKRGLRPICVFGDFDSVSSAERQQIVAAAQDCRLFPPEKDETDLELAIDWALKRQPEKLLIFGATGGRQDHALSAFHFLLKAVGTVTQMVIVDRNNCARLLGKGIYRIVREPAYRYLSFLAFSDKVTGLTLHGAKYPLESATLERGSGLCISNEVKEQEMTVMFSSGLLLMMRCSD